MVSKIKIIRKIFSLLTSVIFCICAFSGIQAIARDDYPLPEAVNKEDILNVLNNPLVLDEIKNNYFEAVASSGEEVTRIIVPFAKKLTVCEPGLTALELSYYKTFTGLYCYVFPLLADDKFVGFACFDSILRLNEVQILDSYKLDYINQFKQVGIFTLDMLRAGGSTSELEFRSPKDETVAARFKLGIDLSKTNSVLDLDAITPLKGIDCSSYKNNLYDFVSGKKYDIANYGDHFYQITDSTPDFTATNDDNILGHSKGIVINEKGNGLVEFVSPANANHKLSVGGISEFKMVFQKDTLTQYKFVSTDASGQEKYLTYNDKTSALSLTSDVADSKSYWQLNKFIREDLSAAEALADNGNPVIQ